MINFICLIISIAFLFFLFEVAIEKDDQPRRSNGHYDFKPKQVKPFIGYGSFKSEDSWRN